MEITTITAVAALITAIVASWGVIIARRKWLGHKPRIKVRLTRQVQFAQYLGEIFEKGDVIEVPLKFAKSKLDDERDHTFEKVYWWVRLKRNPVIYYEMGIEKRRDTYEEAATKRKRFY